METKKCLRCKTEKTIDQFSKNQQECKACNKITNAKFREKRPDYWSEYVSNPETHEKINLRFREYYKNNREKCLEKTKKWQSENQDKVIALREKYKKMKSEVNDV